MDEYNVLSCDEIDHWVVSMTFNCVTLLGSVVAFEALRWMTYVFNNLIINFLFLKLYSEYLEFKEQIIF